MRHSALKMLVSLGIVLALTTCLLADDAARLAPEFSPEAIEFFERKVRPLLSRECYECHSSQTVNLEAGLRLDSRASILQGGDTGPAAIVGDVDRSLMLRAVRHQEFEMPPYRKLTSNDVAKLEQWVRIGLPWPPDEADKIAAAQRSPALASNSGRQFWSFQPVSPRRPPNVVRTEWPRSKFDVFVLAGLEERGFEPTAEADRRTLIRRVYFDLIGLPPTYEAVRAFVGNDSPAAYTLLVDRLLASPHYGERWARLWLDLSRYAEDNPDGALPPRFAYRFRDWVVRSLNDDLPYDEFARRQLAADLMDGLPPAELAALGFLGLSPTYFKGPKQTKEVMAAVVADEWEERIDVVSRTLLGLTVACARCHDHKFDPITTADYYALAGIMASTQLVEQPLVPMLDEDAEYVSGLSEQLRYHEQRYEQRFKQREGLKKDQVPDVYRYDKEILESASEIQRILSLLPDGHEQIPRAPAVRDAASSVDDRDYVIRELHSPEARFWTTVQYDADRVQDVPIHVRGNANQFGRTVRRRFLEVLSENAPRPFQHGSGRLELADCIMGDGAALAGRVIVNRVWGWHFGRPLVGTPSNFGQLGQRPTHPELLDDLTARFIRDGWSLKKLHREIVLSATYRQASTYRDESHAADPENQMLWRMNRRRLDLESWRDATMVATGLLDRSVGGPSESLSALKMRRRAIYARVSRRILDPLLQLFDFPQATRHAPQRTLTTTPLQQLFYLNSDFVRQQANAVSDHVAAATNDETIRAIFEIVLARRPTTEEVELARQLLTDAHSLESKERWAMLAQALLMSNEFLFVD